jgi:hypothetical protein
MGRKNQAHRSDAAMSLIGAGLWALRAAFVAGV